MSKIKTCLGNKYVKKPRFFTGIQASGTLTLGNYCGLINHILKIQGDYEVIVMIADLHALTIPKPNFDYREKCYEIASLLYACGLQEEKSPFTTVSELNNMIQYKEKKKNEETGNLALLSYPVLMAADIFLYDTDLIIVGQDQTQHLELAQHLAQKFNNFYDQKLLKIPQFTIPRFGAKIMGLKNPAKKMSKSENDYIALLDKPEIIIKKIKEAETDSENKIYYDPKNKPGISNLLTIYALLNNREIEAAEKELQNLNYHQFKLQIIDLLNGKLGKIQARYNHCLSNIKEKLEKNNIYLQDLAEKKINIFNKKSKWSVYIEINKHKIKTLLLFTLLGTYQTNAGSQFNECLGTDYYKAISDFASTVADKQLFCCTHTNYVYNCFSNPGGGYCGFILRVQCNKIGQSKFCITKGGYPKFALPGGLCGGIIGDAPAANNTVGTCPNLNPVADTLKNSNTVPNKFSWLCCDANTCTAPVNVALADKTANTNCGLGQYSLMCFNDGSVAPPVFSETPVVSSTFVASKSVSTVTVTAFPNEDSHLTKKIAIPVGTIVGVAAVSGVTYYLISRKRKKKNNSSTQEQNNSSIELVETNREAEDHELEVSLETLLDTQAEIAKGNNTYTLRQTLREAKEKLMKKITSEEIDNLCQLKSEIVQTTEQVLTNLSEQRPELQAQIEQEISGKRYNIFSSELKQKLGEIVSQRKTSGDDISSSPAIIEAQLSLDPNKHKESSGPANYYWWFSVRKEHIYQQAHHITWCLNREEKVSEFKNKVLKIIERSAARFNQRRKEVIEKAKQEAQNKGIQLEFDF
ncbi:13444_t:CDS:2 [Entrophospora sp. SA101]|nr:13444_t:CDS:2 [Entrophospora sp. SA101]